MSMIKSQERRRKEGDWGIGGLGDWVLGSLFFDTRESARARDREAKRLQAQRRRPR
jgi:hypothetical protein